MNEKISIKTELLSELNSSLGGRETAYNTINLAVAKPSDVKPGVLVGDEFDAKEICGDIGSYNDDDTIAGLINTIASEMACFIEGVKNVDEANDISNLLDDNTSGTTTSSGGSGYYSGYSGVVDSGTGDTTIDEPSDDDDEPSDDDDETDDGDDNGEEQTVTPIVIDEATIASEFIAGATGGDDNTTNTGIGTLTLTETGVAITNANGETIGTATDGQYTVYEQMTDENGNVIAVRISPDGEEEQWIRLNQNGTTVGTFYETNQVGAFNCTSDQIVIYDANGNAIGTLPKGNYKVYAIKTDENGNVTAIRISKDGEEEKWIQIFENGKYIDGGEFEQYGVKYTNPQTTDNGQGTTATVYGKRNKILGGVLGVLAVGLGATIYVKKKKQQEDGSYEEEEEELPAGDYDIYDYNTDEDGNLTEARISDDDAAEEQWVEF